jgi:hypothetical protein
MICITEPRAAVRLRRFYDQLRSPSLQRLISFALCEGPVPLRVNSRHLGARYSSPEGRESARYLALQGVRRVRLHMWHT